MHRAALALRSDHRHGSADSSAHFEVRVHQRVQFSIGFANTDFNPRWLTVRFVNSSNFETSNLADHSAVIIDRPCARFAQDRGEIPHLGAEDGRWGDRLQLNGDQVHSIDRQNINTERSDGADSPGEGAGVFGLGHDEQMIDCRTQCPDQRGPSHPFVGGIEHSVAAFRTVGGRDESPGDAEGIVNDQF